MPPQAPVVAALLAAYRDGVFPMADPETGRIDWFSPDPRALMPLGLRNAPSAEPVFHVSRSLARRIRSGRFRITSDTAFEQVIRGCAEPRPGREETWIDHRIVQAYTALHRAGHAHSVEAWLEPDPPPAGPARLVGGVYGVSIGAAFFAESMFSRPELGGTDASKVSLAHLVAHLGSRGFTLMDVQFRNPHINQFGVYTVRRRKYLELLSGAIQLPTTWGSFDERANRAALC
jgi:leucyl/phenylalanyl-tRNA--protein transferase